MSLKEQVSYAIRLGIHVSQRTVALAGLACRRARRAAAQLFAIGYGFMVLAGAAGCPDSGSQVARGTVTAQWSVRDLNQRPTTCTRAGASTVVLRLRDRAGTTSLLSFPCDRSPGSVQVTAASYDIVPELRAADGSILATAAGQTGVIVGAGHVVALGPITFSASTKSVVKLSIAAPPFASNCGALPGAGAGITGTTITLINSVGSCAPVTFERTIEGRPVGTYTVNCGSPSTAACVESSETLTASIDTGSYVIHVHGLVGATTCWTNDDPLDVPPPGQSLVRALNLTRAHGC